jgi:hypothetical protein
MRRRDSWNDCDSCGRIRLQPAFDRLVDVEVEFVRERGLTSAFETMPRVAGRRIETAGKSVTASQPSGRRCQGSGAS